MRLRINLYIWRVKKDGSRDRLIIRKERVENRALALKGLVNNLREYFQFHFGHVKMSELCQAERVEQEKSVEKN